MREGPGELSPRQKLFVEWVPPFIGISGTVIGVLRALRRLENGSQPDIFHGILDGLMWATLLSLPVWVVYLVWLVRRR